MFSGKVGENENTERVSREKWLQLTYFSNSKFPTLEHDDNIRMFFYLL